MAKSLAPPWIKTAVLDIVRDDCPAALSARKGKVVQVLYGNDSVRCVQVSDKERSITVMLTQNCIDKLHQKDPEFTLSSCRNCIVKIETWHLSTIIQTAGDRDVARFRDLNISFPFALQCSKLIMLGATDCTRIGDPEDINRDPGVRQLLARTNYLSLVEQLRARQFPREASLPDPTGIFSTPQLYSDECPLLWEHAVVPIDQFNQIHQKNNSNICSSPEKRSIEGLLVMTDGVADAGVPSDDEYSLLSLHDETMSNASVDAADTLVATQGELDEAPAQRMLWRHGSSLLNRLVYDFRLLQTQTHSPMETWANTLQETPDTVEPTQVDTNHTIHVLSPPEFASEEEAGLFTSQQSQGQSWLTQALDDQFIRDVELRLNGTPSIVQSAENECWTDVAEKAASPIQSGAPRDASQQRAPESSMPEADASNKVLEDQLIGKTLVKRFRGFGVFLGKVTSRRRIYTRRGRAAQMGKRSTVATGDFLYRVVYEDGDAEEMEEALVRKYIASTKVGDKMWNNIEKLSDIRVMAKSDLPKSKSPLTLGSGAVRKRRKRIDGHDEIQVVKSPIISTVFVKDMPFSKGAQGASTLFEIMPPPSSNFMTALSFLDLVPSQRGGTVSLKNTTTTPYGTKFT